MNQKQIISQSLEVVSILQGEIPVVISASPLGDVGIIINFLRCGNPAVQYVDSRWYVDGLEVKAYLSSIALPGESFSIAEKDLAEDDSHGSVITITRLFHK